MNLEAIAPIIQQIIQESLQEKRYKFGFDKHQGVSNKVASGKLKNSVKVNIIQTDQVSKLQIMMEEYYQWVQSGRFSGTRNTPIQPIMDWIKDRHITPKNGNIKGMAFAISNNIKKFGIRPSNFLDVSIEKILLDPRIIELIGQSTEEELINALTGI